MKKLFVALTAFFLCSASFGWAPMDGKIRTISTYGQQYYDIATESQKPYMQPYICYVSIQNPGMTRTYSYSTYDLDLRHGNFTPGIDQLFYITPDNPTFTMIANAGFITPGKNTGTLVFKAVNSGAEAHVVCAFTN